MTDQQKTAIVKGSRTRWLGARETDVMGSTMVALERRGLADVRQTPRRFVYRLTDAGAAKRAELIASA
jgi:hypothetical protein